MDDIFRNKLKKNGLSFTKARMNVFEVLKESSSPISMAELAEKCSEFDRVTIYRIIESFEKINIVNRIQNGWKYKIELGDIFSKHHHHFTCNQCGRVIEFNEPEQINIGLKIISSKYNLHISQHLLELKGLCNKCVSYSS